MSLPEPNREENPLNKFAGATLEKPGMYLIALRAHLNQGKTIPGEGFDSCASTLPKPSEAQDEV